MPNTVTPYNNTQAKKEQVETMFDNIAPRYDLLNRMLSFGVDIYWRKKAIRALRKSHPQTILDVACGTGDFSLAALQVQPAKIIGLDISQEMLNVGKKKIEKAGYADIIELKQGDSENIPFSADDFDAVTVAFGVRNFENLDKGLVEIYRVLKADGQLVILEFSKPGIFPVKQLFNFYFKTICPFIGRLVSKDARAYTYLYESVSAFPEGDAFIHHLHAAGFKKCTCVRLTFGICSLYTAIK
ncbi:MAG: bifunctional demethylmenaquinone methyltransferase/2-methoxy-6-polyprenyl-1,4-benzoquinol methylase UbiE [Chitinophagales bacterium]